VNTLHAVVSSTTIAGLVPCDATSMLLSCLLPNLKDLTISLRLPLSDYEALENDSAEAKFAHTWTKLPTAIRQLSRLRDLHLRLDHDEPRTWSMVNERAVLTPLKSLADIPHLRISVSLPILHPKHETPERHFTRGSAPCSLPIYRCHRQRHHSVDGIHIRHEPDFPILGELAEDWEMSMADVEMMERGEWEMGRDPLYLICGDIEPQCLLSWI
jgi:hypothetical protein